MRYPNGYGSVSKMSGKRRNPWRVRITTGWEVNPETGKKKQITKAIGYYPTKKEAMAALGAYNTDPWDLDGRSMTLAEVYNEWSREYFQTITPSAVRTVASAFRHAEPIHHMNMRDIKVKHLEEVINNADVGQATKARMKSVFNLIYKYALRHEIVDKDYASLCKPIKRDSPKIDRIPFSNAEIGELWASVGIPFADMILIGIYTGFRPGELSVLQIEDLDFEQMTIKGGSKTEAGRDRLVPIHPLIVDLIRNRYAEAQSINSAYLFNDLALESNKHLNYDKYRRRFEKVLKRLKMAHTMHDTRHTFITLAKQAGMDEYILKLIVGHAIRDVTEKVYTHRTIEEMHTEIRKIKIGAME